MSYNWYHFIKLIHVWDFNKTEEVITLCYLKLIHVVDFEKTEEVMSTMYKYLMTLVTLHSQISAYGGPIYMI